MKLHEIIEINKEPYFRKMRVESGFMYNFYDVEKDEYKKEWSFVPDESDEFKKLQHHKDTTVGLWATDAPDAVNDPKSFSWKLSINQITKVKTNLP